MSRVAEETVAVVASAVPLVIQTCTSSDSPCSLPALAALALLGKSPCLLPSLAVAQTASDPSFDPSLACLAV